MCFKYKIYQIKVIFLCKLYFYISQGYPDLILLHSSFYLGSSYGPSTGNWIALLCQICDRNMWLWSFTEPHSICMKESLYETHSVLLYSSLPSIYTNCVIQLNFPISRCEFGADFVRLVTALLVLSRRIQLRSFTLS